MMDRCIAFHRQHPERFFDIHYEPLIADPMAKTRDIYSFIGAEWTADAEAKMRQWAVENAREKRPVHRYTLEKFGFTEAGLRADFANYGRFVDELLEK